MSQSEPTTIEEWIESRPDSVKALAKEFPIGSELIVKGKRLYLLGYGEPAEVLIFTPIDPNRDWEKANREKVYICADHFRNKDICGICGEKL